MGHAPRVEGVALSPPCLPRRNQTFFAPPEATAAADQASVFAQSPDDAAAFVLTFA